ATLGRTLVSETARWSSLRVMVISRGFTGNRNNSRFVNCQLKKVTDCELSTFAPCGRCCGCASGKDPRPRFRDLAQIEDGIVRGATEIHGPHEQLALVGQASKERRRVVEKGGIAR